MSIISEALRRANDSKRPSPHISQLSKSKPAKEKRWQSLLKIWGVLFLFIGAPFILLYRMDIMQLSQTLVDASKNQMATQKQTIIAQNAESQKTAGSGQMMIEVQNLNPAATPIQAGSLYKQFDLSGIAKTQDGYFAVINGIVVSQGDDIDGILIKEITEREVTLSSGAEDVTISKKF